MHLFQIVQRMNQQWSQWNVSEKKVQNGTTKSRRGHCINMMHEWPAGSHKITTVSFTVNT